MPLPWPIDLAALAGADEGRPDVIASPVQHALLAGGGGSDGRPGADVEPGSAVHGNNFSMGSVSALWPRTCTVLNGGGHTTISRLEPRQTQPSTTFTQKLLLAALGRLLFLATLSESAQWRVRSAAATAAHAIALQPCSSLRNQLSSAAPQTGAAAEQQLPVRDGSVCGCSALAWSHSCPVPRTVRHCTAAG